MKQSYCYLKRLIHKASVYNHLQNWIIITDAKGIAVWANTTFYMESGFRSQDLIGRYPWDVVMDASEHKSDIERILSAVNNGESLSFQVTNQKKCGTPVAVQLKINPVYDISNSLVGWVGEGLDVSDFVQLRSNYDSAIQQLTQLNEKLMLDSEERYHIFNAVSHDLRTPLHGISLLIEQLSHSAQSVHSATNISKLNKIQTNVDFIIRLSENLILLNQIKSHKISLKTISVSLLEVVNKVTLVIQQNLKLKKQNIEVIYNSSFSYLVKVDPNVLQQCLVNFISNASKYSSEGSKIILKLEFLQKKVQLTIQDFGSGMSPEFVKTLGADFNREKLTTNKKVTGSGLGFSIAKRFLTIQNIKLNVVSKLGFGTEIILKFPTSIAND